MTFTICNKVSSTTLSGSVQTVVEYLEFSVHSLLYQRGLYPADDFQIVKKYNLSLLLSNDDKVKEYIATIMKQLHRMFFSLQHWRGVSLSLLLKYSLYGREIDWLEHKVISKVVLVISNRETGQILERWSFDIKIFPGTSQVAYVPCHHIKNLTLNKLPIENLSKKLNRKSQQS